MTRTEIIWLLTFLERSVPRGENELMELEKLIEKLRGALKQPSQA